MKIPTIRVSVEVPDTTMRFIDRKALCEGRSRSSMIRQILRDYALLTDPLCTNCGGRGFHGSDDFPQKCIVCDGSGSL